MIGVLTVGVAAASGSTRGLRAWSTRHPVSAFLRLAFAIACPFMSLPILADHGVIPGGWMPQLPGSTCSTPSSTESSTTSTTTTKDQP